MARSGGAPRALLALLLLGVLPALAACGGTAGEPVAPAGAGGKVLVIGIGGVTWDDLREAEGPAIRALVERGAAGDVSVRVLNRAAEAYAALGAGQRAEAGPSAGWAFGREEIVEGGPAIALFRRRSGRGVEGDVVVASIGEIVGANGLLSFGARPGLLGSRLAARGGTSAVLGNADHARGALPGSLPGAGAMAQEPPPDPGIHREAALAAMREDGGVDRGDVGRGLLHDDPAAPFGVATSPAALVEAFRRVWPASDLVVVETGDPARADAFSAGAPASEAARIRREALARADRLVGSLVAEVDPRTTLVVVLAPTTPGGPRARGQLRPAVVAGPGVPHGVLTSGSTRRPGIVTVADLTATIARHLSIAGDGFASGRVVRAVATAGDTLEPLADANRRAVVHDRLRGPVSIAVILFDLAVSALAAGRLRRGTLPRPLTFALVASLGLPLASYVTTAGVWRLGEPAAAAAIVAAGAGVAWLATRLGDGGAAAAVLAATSAFLAADLAAGAPAQLDSVFGYTSVAGGRFFGVGNLASALLAASALLLGGVVSDRGPRGRWAALAIVAGATLVLGLPGMGADVGGTLTIVPAGFVLMFPLLAGRPPRARHLALAAAGALVVLLGFGAVDLLRPAAERTHLGAFLAGLATDPLGAGEIVLRKAAIAARLTVTTRWGLAVLPAAAVLVWMHRRSRDRWRDLVRERPGARAGLRAVLVAAVVGSLVNDSGGAVAGMMLTMAVPWALVVASGASGAAVE